MLLDVCVLYAYDTPCRGEGLGHIPVCVRVCMCVCIAKRCCNSLNSITAIMNERACEDAGLVVSWT